MVVNFLLYQTPFYVHKLADHIYFHIQGNCTPDCFCHVIFQGCRWQIIFLHQVCFCKLLVFYLLFPFLRTRGDAIY